MEVDLNAALNVILYTSLVHHTQESGKVQEREKNESLD